MPKKIGYGKKVPTMSELKKSVRHMGGSFSSFIGNKKRPAKKSK